MTYYIYQNQSGEFKGISLYNSPPPEYTSIEKEGDRPVFIDDGVSQLFIVEGELVYRDPRTLGQIKADKWAEIKAQRSAREAGTFTAVGHVFQVDSVKLVGAALDAYFAKQTGEAYSQAWVLADNTAVMLTADEMIAAGRGCKAYVSGLWGVSQMLRGEILAAQDGAAVGVVAWPVGP